MFKSVRVAARETMQRFSYDPLEVLILHAQQDATSPGEKREIAEVLMPYMYPKLANVSVETENNSSSAAESQSALLQRVLASPELADAAQRLSLAAAEAAIEGDLRHSIM